MTQPRKEQINILRSYWSVFTYTATGGTTSTVIAAGTLQPSTVTQTPGGNPSTNPPIRGIITTGGGGFVRLRKVDNALSLDDTGVQIFGRLTFSAGNYTVTYKKFSGGVEVSATLPSVGTYSVEMLLPEVMVFGEIPANADIIYGSFQELLPSGNTISGDLVVSGNTTLGDATSDTILLNARFISDLIPTPDNTRSLGSSALRFANGNFTQYTARADNTDSVKSIFNASGITATGTAFGIDGNSSLSFGTSTTTGITIGRVGITTIINGTFSPTGNTTIGGTLTVNGSPSTFNGDLNVTGTLTAGTLLFSDLNVSGNSVLGDDPTTDTINMVARLIGDIVPKFPDLYDVGKANLRFREVHDTRIFNHADNVGSVYSLLDSDSLFSSVSFDVDGYGALFLGVTHATDVQIGRTSVSTTINATQIQLNTQNVIGLNNGGLSIVGAFAPTETDGSDITVRGPTGGSSTGAAPGGAGGRAFLLGGSGGFAAGAQPGGNGGDVGVNAGGGIDGNVNYSPSNGGGVGISAGNAGQFFGFGGARGGNVEIRGGDGYLDNTVPNFPGGGDVDITGGNSTADNSNAGGVSIRGGDAFFGFGGRGGGISIISGNGASDVAAGDISIEVGQSGFGSGSIGIGTNFSAAATVSIGATSSNVAISGNLNIFGFTSWQGTGYPSFPNSGGVAFAIEGTPVGPTVLAPALDTLTNGSNADALHVHAMLSPGGTSYVTTSVQTGTYGAFIGDLVRCNPTGGGFTVNLPTASGNVNKSIIVKNVTSSTNAVTIDAFGSETIDGSLTQVITIGFQAITLISDGTNWMIV